MLKMNQNVTQHFISVQKEGIVKLNATAKRWGEHILTNRKAARKDIGLAIPAHCLH